MKRLIVFAAACLCSAQLFAQHKVYCEIVEQKKLNGKQVNITIDFGQKRDSSRSSSQQLVDETGEVIIFNSKIDALNYMDRLGWNFLQAYTSVHGSNGDTSSVIRWLLYKEVSEGEDPYQGLTTKEKFNK